MKEYGILVSDLKGELFLVRQVPEELIPEVRGYFELSSNAEIHHLIELHDQYVPSRKEYLLEGYLKEQKRYCEEHISYFFEHAQTIWDRIGISRTYVEKTKKTELARYQRELQSINQLLNQLTQ